MRKVLLFICSLCLISCNPKSSKVPNVLNGEIENNISPNRAKNVVVDVLGRKPIYAFGYTEGKDNIIAIINENESEDDIPGGYISWYPQLRMVILSNESGDWEMIKDQKLDMNAIIHGENDCYIQCEFDESCAMYRSSGKLYLYFHIQRTIGGNATANIVNDFVCLSLLDAKMSVIEYIENIDNVYSQNGELLKKDYYPEGIEEYLLHKIEIDKSLEKTEQTVTEEVLDVKKILVQWNADNPKRPQEFDSGDTQKHKARVRYYTERPFIDDYNDCRDSYTITNLNDYVVYSRWRGEVYAFDKNKEQYFLVWSESFNYNDKKVIDKGDGWIQMVYVDAFDMDNMTDAIMYNLETKEYYFMKVKNTFI